MSIVINGISVPYSGGKIQKDSFAHKYAIANNLRFQLI